MIEQKDSKDHREVVCHMTEPKGSKDLSEVVSHDRTEGQQTVKAK